MWDAVAEAATLERALLLEFCRERYFSDRWKRLGALVTRARDRKLRRFARLAGAGHGWSERQAGRGGGDGRSFGGGAGTGPGGGR